ncbi:putative GTP-binding protein YjiA [Hydrogenophaga sp. T4]|nr:putative GTP-binding protein YjiA [Hydrogenophaga sp. T4]
MSLIPATILTGFLGSGKTTLLKRVLTEAHGQKIAVIENEFGEENIDNEILVADTQENIIQMSNGCICCTIRDDLRATLQDLAEKKRKGELQFDRVVIETTGLADPGPVAQTFFMDDEVAEQYLLDSILTLVDAKHAAQQLNDRQEARRQVGFADQIFISKADLVDKDELDALIHRLKHMNRARHAPGAFRRGGAEGSVRPARFQPERQARHRSGLPQGRRRARPWTRSPRSRTRRSL